METVAELHIRDFANIVVGVVGAVALGLTGVSLVVGLVGLLVPHLWGWSIRPTLRVGLSLVASFSLLIVVMIVAGLFQPTPEDPVSQWFEYYETARINSQDYDMCWSNPGSPYTNQSTYCVEYFTAGPIVSISVQGCEFPEYVSINVSGRGILFGDVVTWLGKPSRISKYIGFWMHAFWENGVIVAVRRRNARSIRPTSEVLFLTKLYDRSPCNSSP